MERAWLYIEIKNKRKLGSTYEEQAVEYLYGQGLSVKEKNFRCRLGEIDLIAQDGNCLVFVEVKYRRNTASGCALEAVNKAKQKRISRAAAWYLSSRFRTVDIPCRFDVLGFDGSKIIWIKDAFDFCG